MSTVLKRIIETITGAGMKKISVIGLAKNTGKTVTLNTLAAEAHGAGLRTALISFGRDGEAVDAITRLDKPRIHVFSGTQFVTAERFLNPAVVDVASETGTGIKTLFGEARIYTSGPKGGRVELIGINTVSSLKKTLAILEKQADLIFIDGALDRRSSAIPVFSDACVLATGAVLGKDEQEVIRHTDEAMAKLSVGRIEDSFLEETAKTLYKAHQNGVVYSDGSVIQKDDSADVVASCTGNDRIRAVFLRGALTDRLIDPLLNHSVPPSLTLVVKDATRLFLSNRSMVMLKNRNVKVKVLHPVRILMLTVNPTRPFEPDMDSEYLVSAFRSMYPGLLCCNVLLLPQTLLLE